jgi:hypothetical protein
MRISLKTLGILMGIGFVLLFAALSVLYWKAGVEAYYTFLHYSTFIPWMAVGLALACWLWRQKSGPYVTFLSALQFFFVAYLIYELGYALVTVVLYDALDKTLYYRVLDYSLTQKKLQYIQQHLPIVQIQDALDDARKHSQEGVTTKQVILGFGQNLLLDFVKSLLLAIVLQRKPPVETAPPERAMGPLPEKL